MKGPGIVACEAARGGDRDFRAGPIRFGAFAVGHAWDRQGRFFRGGCAGEQGFGRWLHRIGQVQIGNGERHGLCDPGEGILRHHARHGDSTLCERGEFRRIGLVRRDDGLLLAHEDAQSEIDGFRTLQLLDTPEPALDGERSRGGQQGIGLVGAGATRGRDELLQAINLRHAARLSAIEARLGTLPAGPSAASVGLPRKAR